jgi:5-methylcytosine-specific restriction protein A
MRSADAERYRRLYFTPAWRQLRTAQLARCPFCAMCAAMGRRTPATIADHRKPHRGDAALFFDPSNLQSLCGPHHSSTKQRQEHGRPSSAVGVDGWPAAPRSGQ